MESKIKALLIDIEGTTSSLSYVKDVMFPYSKQRLRDFLSKHWQEERVSSIIRKLEERLGKRIDLEEAVKVFEDWIDRDLKEPLLKELQGHIWEEGFLSGELRGHIYEDAYKRLKEWKKNGYKLYIFSSGSVKAQKLFFGHTDYVDLTGLFDGFFDTTIGSKKGKESYERIAKEVGLEPKEFLFLSDVEEELNAARDAGMNTIKLDRYDSKEHSSHRIVKSFLEIDLP